MTSDEIKKKAKEIEDLYVEYEQKIEDLKKERKDVLKGFLHKLEEAKLEEIRNQLKN